jgi:hypothetical protein
MQLADDSLQILLGILIGLLPGQAARLLDRRAERRKAIALALADLLEIRHQLTAMELAVERILAVFPMAQVQEPAIRLALAAFLPNPSELHQRYDEAVTRIAALEPIVAYELRSKDLVRPILQQVTTLMNQDHAAGELFSPIFKKLVKEELRPQLKKAVLRLAWRHGAFTRIKVRKSLAKQDEMPEGIDAMIAPLRMAASSTQ